MKENVAAILGSESRMAILKDFDTLLWETTAMRDDDKNRMTDGLRASVYM
jgi:hypothetical protein